MTREPRPTEVAELLTSLREAAGLGITAAADLAAKQTDNGRFGQSTLTRYERGEQTPDRRAVDALIAVYNPDHDAAYRLRNLTRDERPKHRRVVLHRADAPRYQAEYHDLEQEAVRIRSFTCTVAPGLLQVADYAAAIISGAELSDEKRARWTYERARRRELVNDPARHLQFVITRGALDWNLGGHPVMREQVGRLIDASRLDHIALGVITGQRDSGLAVTNNIDLYERADGRHTVVIGTSAGTSLLTDGREIEHHTRLLDRLAELAAWGDEARAVLAEIAEQYREE